MLLFFVKRIILDIFLSKCYLCSITVMYSSRNAQKWDFLTQAKVRVRIFAFIPRIFTPYPFILFTHPLPSPFPFHFPIYPLLLTSYPYCVRNATPTLTRSCIHVRPKPSKTEFSTTSIILRRQSTSIIASNVKLPLHVTCQIIKICVVPAADSKNFGKSSQKRR